MGNQRGITARRRFGSGRFTLIKLLIAAAMGWPVGAAPGEEDEDAGLGYVTNPNQILGLELTTPAADEPTTQALITRRPAVGGGPTGSGILYVRDEIPPVHYPPIRGQRYETVAPDTLDLARRARLAIAGMTQCADPRADYEIYGWMGNGMGGLPAMKHSYHDYNGGQPKWMESLLLLRTVSGSEFNIEVDRGMIATMFHMLGEDGLYWIPAVGSPWWGEPDSAWPWTEEGAKQIYDIWPTARALTTLALYSRYYPEDPAYKRFAENLIRGLSDIAIDKGDYVYIRRHFYDGNPPQEERLWVVKDGKLALGPVEVPTDITVVTTHAGLLTGLARYYEATGFEPAKTLADKLANYLLGPARVMNEDGTWVELTHFHGMTLTLMGLFDYAQVMNRPGIMERVRKGYEYGRRVGDVTLGWFPEYSPANHPNTEPCGIADMTILASKLSEAGVGDYWEDVEQIARNLLVEAQCANAWVIERRAETSGGAPPGPDARLVTTENVAQRMVGTFAGMTGVNGSLGAASSHCCTGNGSRALYFAWKPIVTEADGTVRVNLLLNRASRWADVNSHLPNQGRVDVIMKEDRRLMVRVPSWVAGADAVRCRIDGEPKPIWMAGRYLDAGVLKAGQVVTLEFPLRDETVKRVIHEKTYTVRLRGFTVVDIWPRGELDPYFNRPRDRAPQTRLARVERFVAARPANW